jgi:molybdopterin molybdotransferase
MSRNHNHETLHPIFRDLTPIPEALRIILDSLQHKTLGTEKVPLSSANGRVLAEDVFSNVDIPPFERSTRDGYAVIAKDTCGAGLKSPVCLRVIGATQIGTPPTVRVSQGEAVSIVTGANIPHGASAVVMVEDTLKREDETLEILREVSSGENVTHTGEDVRKGSLVLRKGTQLLPQDIGMLTHLGLSQVFAKTKPKVAVLSTGSELGAIPDLSSGRIPDVNRPTLISALRELDCEPIDLGIVADDFDQIRNKLEYGIKSADIVLVTAGTSVGPRDLVPEIINSLGKPGMLVHGVAMRPAMPTGLAVVDGKPVISLPGFPVSAYIAFLELVQPLVSYLLGIDSLPRPTVKARLSKSVSGDPGSRTYIRVLVASSLEGYTARPVPASSSAILSSLVQANGFVIIPEGSHGYDAGQEVDVQLFRPPEPRQTTR